MCVYKINRTIMLLYSVKPVHLIFFSCILLFFIHKVLFILKDLFSVFAKVHVYDCLPLVF